MPSAGDLVWPIAVSTTEALSGFSRVVYVPNRQMPCPLCAAHPEQAPEPCVECGGTGLQTTLKRIMVDVPSIRGDLQRLRVRGGGNYVEAEHCFGDLILVCHVRPEADLSLADGVLRRSVDLPARQASLGGAVEVAVLNHILAVDLPAGLVDGQRLELSSEAVAGIGSPLPVVLDIHVVPDDPEPAPSAVTGVADLYRLAAAAEAEGCFEAARDLYAEIAKQTKAPKASVKQSAMHLRLGETGLAVRAMEHAMALSPNDAEISYYLAMCHARNGDNLIAAVELERARQAGLPAARADEAHRRITKTIFMPTAGLTSSQLDGARKALKLALDRYYGAASGAYQAMLELGEEPQAHYWHGAANWLLTVESGEDQLATAYLSLAEAARSAPGAHRSHRDTALIRDELLSNGSITSRTRVCTHLVREGQAQDAQDFLFSALRKARRLVPAAQREVSSALQASRAFLQTCEPYAGTHSTVQAVWQRAFSQVGQAAVRLDQALPDERGLNELTRGELGNLMGLSSEVVREVLLPVLRGLESEIEQSVRISPRYHALLEQAIEWSGRMSLVSQSISQCNSALLRGGGAAQQASAEAFDRLRREVGTIYAAMETHNAEIGNELSCVWRCLAFALQLDVRLRSLLTAEEPLRDARTLARALEFLQGAINIDPDFAISDESRQMFCDLLDDFQSCAQVAAGSGALARVELLQNTMDAINSQVSPFSLAEATNDLLSEEKLKLFDWAVETLFRNAAPLPREFIIAAKMDCYAATNYRFAHRIPDATNHQVLPLNQIDRYDVHVSGVTMRNVLVTLRDGRRLTFSGVRTGDVFPQEQMSWLLGAHMWQNLAEVELEALSTGRAAPTYALAAQGSHDRRELPAGQAAGQLPAATGTKTCGQCGRHNFVRDRFCRDCGSPLQTEQAALPPNALTPRLLRSPNSEE